MAHTGNEPISAANLKAVIERLKQEVGGGVLLYSSETENGSAQVDIGEPITNFRAVEIAWKQSSSSAGSALINVGMLSSFIGGSYKYLYFPGYTTSGNAYATFTFPSDGIIRSNDVGITAVIGYR